MTFLHSKTTATIKRLVSDSDDNSEYQIVEGDFIGHFKKIDQMDGSFDISNIDGTAYKFTAKKKLDIKPSDRLIISEGDFAGSYSVMDFKFSKGISFETTKIFVVK